MDNPQNRHPDQGGPLMPSEAELRAVMEQSDRDVAAGRTASLADVLAELADIADQTEARRRARRA